MAKDVIVLGAGIVGLSAAIHLAKRGRSVLLVDRKQPGRETSFGNGGIIQSEGVRPHRFPHDLAALAGIAARLNPAVRYHLMALPRLAGPLLRYWYHSVPKNYLAIMQEYAPLIRAAAAEHEQLAEEAGAGALITRNGWLQLHHSQAEWDAACVDADFDEVEFGVGHRKLDPAALRQLEPGLTIPAIGAIHWTDASSIRDPGALADAYLALFRRLGGTFVTGDAASLDQGNQGWTVETESGLVSAEQVVVALGPWAAPLTRRLGYRLPLFIKRGYHMHYADQSEIPLRRTMVDAERGYILAPMNQGLRMTTGVEFAALDTVKTPKQLDRAERWVRRYYPLGERLHGEPWMGSRPCTPDMKPIIGPAHKHEGLWFAFGHAHHGLTLGPITGRLLAEQMSGERPFIDLAPFSADRFS